MLDKGFIDIRNYKTTDFIPCIFDDWCFLLFLIYEFAYVMNDIFFKLLKLYFILIT